MPRVLTEQEAQRIIAALQAKNIIQRPCPICGQSQWTLNDGYTPTPIRSTRDDGNMLSGEFNGTVSLFCNNCGFMRHHLITPLGL